MLSPKAGQIIDKYFNLPFTGVLGVRCPYFNNARKHLRGQLRGLIGKGTPEEIAEEAKIISTQYRHDIFDKDGHCCLHGEHTDEQKADNIRKFLIDNNLGVDCSGFVSHILIQHFKETKNTDISRLFYFWSAKNFWRYLVAKLRPVESMSVRVYAKAENTKKIADGRSVFDWFRLEPGDLVIMLETGPNKKRNHILLIEDNDGSILRYVHARAWSAEGKYGHGVARGEIRMLNSHGSLLDQTWDELGKTGEENETFLEAKNAHVLEVRRVII